MNKLTNYKDSRIFLTVHFLSSELGFTIWAIIVFVLLVITEKFSLLKIIIILLITVLFILIKLFGITIYERVFFKTIKDSLIAKLFKNLRQNNNNARLIFLFIVTLPYNINTLFNMIVSYDWWYRFLKIHV